MSQDDKSALKVDTVADYCPLGQDQFMAKDGPELERFLATVVS